LEKVPLSALIAGIWPFAEGEIELPEKHAVLYLPQKPYVPIGSLREALLFPHDAGEFSDEVIKQALTDCHLQGLTNRLHESARWSEILSPGELQRINFARILLHKPEWVFLDESTSSLDLENEKYLYNLLKEKLSGCTVVSVGHQPSMEAFHETVIDMGQYVH
jgi:putative ATP-binding cassette transporter